MDYLVIYLHGFLSSPQSFKAQQTKAFVNRHYPKLTLEVPKLANYPLQAAQTIENIIAQHPNKKLRFVGSSLGGYLSTYMREKYGGKAVLVNPAVKPYDLLVDYLGEHTSPYTDEAFLLEHKHITELISLDSPRVTNLLNYWVLLQTADETLDYRQAEQKYHGCKMTIEPGGDHSFQHFERFLPDIFRFLLQD
ncbi:esterase YqiA [Paraglaciecola aquimarina]|uniref:Esterase YqiA n=1 Tax=Paraglaciecola algarum TaxID=3050085 RepID=A0ABS9DBR4_9ALTE|nr:YqiA/YcfP family alpha/beta fold hydrolase [Paraglaciecola sp. G1-23]MCF2949076.1 esterase YqiA [Paraglaciecola sp. G1-23]